MGAATQTPEATAAATVEEEVTEAGVTAEAGETNLNGGLLL